jgi:hypothetical protein
MVEELSLAKRISPIGFFWKGQEKKVVGVHHGQVGIYGAHIHSQRLVDAHCPKILATKQSKSGVREEAASRSGNTAFHVSVFLFLLSIRK